MSEEGAPTATAAGPSSAQHPHHQPSHHHHHQQQSTQQQQSHPPPSAAPQMPPARLSVHDIRNSDLVSRLLAATPPYLYSTPVGPPNFFFSDMLRSLVQSKHAEQASRTANNAAMSSSGGHHQSSVIGHPHHQPGSAPLTGRRPRKRTWTQARTSPLIGAHTAGSMFDLSPKVLNNNNNLVPPPLHEKPLELTNKCGSPLLKYASHSGELSEKMMRSAGGKSPSSSSDVKPPSHGLTDFAVHNNNNNNNDTGSVEPAPLGLTSVPSGSTDLVLPPPPPMWYPPLYPPYGIDPLHFFIDLRVSGHIYDRKKENTSPNAGAAAPLDTGATAMTLMPHGDAAGGDVQPATKPRFGSAFSVPQSRRDKSPSARALNLTASPAVAPTTPDTNHKSHLMATPATSAAPSMYSTTHTTYDHDALMDTALKDAAAAAAAAKNNTTNYVLQNLPRIYTDLTSQMGGDERNSTNSDDSKSDGDGGSGGCDVGGGGGGGGGDDTSDSGDVVIVDGKNHGNY